MLPSHTASLGCPVLDRLSDVLFEDCPFVFETEVAKGWHSDEGGVWTRDLAFQQQSMPREVYCHPATTWKQKMGKWNVAEGEQFMIKFVL